MKPWVRQAGWLAAALLLAAPACPQVNGTTVRPPGDLNGDLRVTVEDAIVALRIAARLRNSTEVERRTGDVAPAKGTGGRIWGDGSLNVSDVSRILRRAVGLEPDPWPGGPAFALSTREFTLQITESASPFFWSLDEGVVVNGKLVDAAGKPLSATVYFWNAARRLVGRVTSDTAGAFRFTAPTGLYRLSVKTARSVTGSTATVDHVQADVATVTVSEGMPAVTVTRPALSPLRKISGVLNDAPEGYVPTSVEFVDSERVIEVTPPPTTGSAPVIAATGRFNAYLPNGSYKVLVRYRRGDKTGDIAFLTTTLATVVADRDLTLFGRPIGSLSGSFDINGAAAEKTGTVLSRALLDANRGAGSTGLIRAGLYDLPLQPGISSDVAFAPDTLNPATAPGARLIYLLPAQTVQGNNARNVVIPTPPARIAMTAWVGDTLGRPVPGARLLMEAGWPNNLPNRYVLTLEADADRHGVVMLRIPEGFYGIAVMPPGDLPSVLEVTER